MLFIYGQVKRFLNNHDVAESCFVFGFEEQAFHYKMAG